MPAPDLPRTRAEAQARGGTRYFTGQPCRHGHIAARNTANAQCVRCANGAALRCNRASRGSRVGIDAPPGRR